MTTLELFRAIVLAMPIAVVPDATVNAFLALVATRLDAVAFGTRLDEATVWLTAHLLFKTGTLAIAGSVPAVSGTISSLKTGDESVAFASAAASGGIPAVDADLMSTHYGLQFISIRDTRSATAPTFIFVG